MSDTAVVEAPRASRFGSSWSTFVVLVGRQLRAQTKRSTVGLLWPAIAPFFLLVLYIFVFKTVLKVPIANYGEYLLAGLVPWVFMAQSLGATVTSLSAEGDIIRRARFPYEYLPIASAGVMGLYFLADLVAVLVYLGARGHLAAGPLVFLPVCILATFLLTFSLSVVLAFVDVYNRDLRRILGNLLTIWFFLLPIVYRPKMVPVRFRFLTSVDPLNMNIGEYREVLYYHHVGGHMFLMAAVCLTLFLVVIVMFRRLSADLPKDV